MGSFLPWTRNSVSVLYPSPLSAPTVPTSPRGKCRSGWQISEQWAELASEGDGRVWWKGQDTDELSFLCLQRVQKGRSLRVALSWATWSLSLLRVSLSQTGNPSPLRARYCNTLFFLPLPPPPPPRCVPFPAAVGALSIPLCSLRP